LCTPLLVADLPGQRRGRLQQNGICDWGNTLTLVAIDQPEHKTNAGLEKAKYVATNGPCQWNALRHFDGLKECAAKEPRLLESELESVVFVFSALAHVWLLWKIS